MKGFEEFIARLGLTQEDMDAAVMPPPLFVYEDGIHAVGESAIQGLGVFAGFGAVKGEHLCTLRIGEDWTDCGRYINHDDEPNAKPVREGAELYAIACAEIAKGGEVTLNYNEVYQQTKRET